MEVLLSIVYQKDGGYYCIIEEKVLHWSSTFSEEFFYDKRNTDKILLQEGAVSSLSFPRHNDKGKCQVLMTSHNEMESSEISSNNLRASQTLIA